VVPTSSKTPLYKDRINLKCTSFSGTRWKQVSLINKGVFSIKVSVHMTPGSREATAVDHKENISSFY